MSRYFYSKDNFMTTLGFAVGLLGVGYGIAMHTKVSKISERLDKSIDELAGGMEIDIPKALVDQAVERAVAAEAKTAVARATGEVIGEMKRDIRDKVTLAVDKEYDAIKDKVLQEATEAASKIDVARVRRDVEQAAERAAQEKFDDNLDEILRKFNENLSNTSRIYSSIAGAMVKPTDAGKELVFRVG